MEKKHLPKGRIYHSRGILGQLYDEVDLVNFQPQYELPFDDRILTAYDLEETMLDAAKQVKKDYDAAMRRVMAQHGIGSEFEVWSGFVLQHNFEKRDYTFSEEIGRIMSALRDQFRQRCIEKVGDSDFSKLGPFVAALYVITSREIGAAIKEYRQINSVDGSEAPLRKIDFEHMPLISVPWIFVSELGRIATGAIRVDVKSHKYWKGLQQKRDPDAFVPGQDDIEIEGDIAHRGDILQLFDENTSGGPVKNIIEEPTPSVEHGQDSRSKPSLSVLTHLLDAEIPSLDWSDEVEETEAESLDIRVAEGNFVSTNYHSLLTCEQARLLRLFGSILTLFAAQPSVGRMKIA